MENLRTKAKLRDRRATEDALIASASRAFSEHGYESTTTKAVAEEASCSEALIQRYFGGKEGLLLAVLLREDFPPDIEAFFDRPLYDSLRDELRETLGHIVRWLTRGSDRMRIVFSRVLLDANFKEHFNRISVRDLHKEALMRRFATYREAGRIDADTDLNAAAEMMLGLCFELGFMQSQVLHVSEDDRNKLLEGFSDLVERALTPRLPANLAGNAGQSKSKANLR